MRRADDQRGSATVLVLAMAGVLLLVGAALGVVVAMVRTHRLAQSAADLAALAGARAAQLGGDPCGQAAEIARANGARLTACSSEGSVVTLRVTVPGPHWLGQSADLSADSRAGPVSSVSPATDRRGSSRGHPTARPRAPAGRAAGDSPDGAAARVSRRSG